MKWNNDFPELREKNDIYLKDIPEKVYYDRWWNIMEGVMRRGMPIFVLNQEKNNVRMVYDINIRSRSFKVTPEYDPAKMTNLPGIYQQHLGKREKRKAVMRVFDKVSGLIPEDKRKDYIPDGTESDGRGMYNIH
jgi:hypothetical protein